MTSTSTALVLVDSLAAPLRDADLELVTIARDLGDVAVVSFDAPSAAVLDQLGAHGVVRVVELAVDGEPHLTGVAAHALTRVTDGARVLLARATFAHKEVLARLALLTGAGLIIDAAQVREGESGSIVGAKRVFAGTWDLVCEVRSPLALLTVRPNAVHPSEVLATTTPSVERIAVPAEEASAAAGGVRLVSRTVHEVDAEAGPALAEAASVVAGGRGTGGDFGPVRDLADALGAAVGSTRDCVDEGWIEHDTQIGQTGVTISPRLYVGAGVSGAPHHRGGMQASEVIVAVNSDPECPIFEICDFAVVGDLATVLPQAAAAIRERRG